MVIESLELIDWQLAEIETRISRLLDEQQGLNEQIAGASDPAEFLRARREIQVQLEGARLTMADLEQQRGILEIETFKMQLRALLREAHEFQHQADELSADIRALERQLDNLREERARLYMQSVDRQQAARSIELRLADCGPVRVQ